jgi:predicted RNA-binding Zn ribbon-like protein
MDQAGAGTFVPLLGEPLPVELMNTIWADRDGVHDALATSEQACGWLQAIRDRLAPQPSAVTTWLAEARPEAVAPAVDQLRLLRDALRRLAAETTADPRPAAEAATRTRVDALRVLDRACAAAPTWSSLRWADGEEPRRELHSDATPRQVVVATLAEQAVDLFTSEQAAGLRACLAPGCVLYFVRQHPRREWCSAACGNRARVARHYRRHRAQPAETAYATNDRSTP